MKEIEIKNQYVLDLLDEVVWFYDNRDQLENIKPNCDEHKSEDYLSEDYLKKIVNMGSNHDGYPEKLKGYTLNSSETYQYNNPKEIEKRLPLEWLEKYSDLNKRIMSELSVRNNAVATLYPPDGYISWHNNANATGFNLIFTWSETGDGWFDYIEDNGKGKRVRCQDKKGQWVCRYGMFGAYSQDKYPVVYHAADSNGGWRITLAFVFSPEEASADLQEYIIDELINI
jgi:hypothetical protein